MEKLTAIESDAQSQAWLKQFNLGDRALAKKLLEAFVLVSRDDFVDHMRAMRLFGGFQWMPMDNNRRLNPSKYGAFRLFFRPPTSITSHAQPPPW